ncbi:S9 family peptidase [Stenotrophomonas sp. SY1]|uniref:S9 family peptidase n=1 Tax=Stenotrophomonas sp. SY1 TaxID=477235 RepID=UPI001E5261DC|nr:S9 family peptidase [Stenotrophomonas sp. SY1]MCD9085246.1 S9 family peptidase [Stenotrophomonas sp. SY1]
MQRSLALREQWIGLTRDVAWPARWHDDGRFHYRKTVEGGFRFLLADPVTGRSEDAFDHARLAQAITTATGQAQQALRLPFEDYSEERADGHSIALLDVAGTSLRCDLQAYVCTPQPASTRRPRGFGVVRDLRVPADPTPQRSPDGQWEAFAQGYNLALRRVADGSVRALTHDGDAQNFHDPESIVWSPDSRQLAFYRVKPGTARLVTRVETAPPGGGQPNVQLQLYPKPGDAVDIERPLLADVANGKLTVIDDALFANPYRLSPIRWRADGRGFAFDYIQRGHQRVRLIEVAAGDGQARTVVNEDSRTFVDAWRPYQYEIDDGKQVLWLSERDGWRHLYLYDGLSGKPLRQLTRGDWVVREVLKIDAKRREVWFSASGMDARRDPYFRQAFRVSLDGGEPVRLTHADADHDVAPSPDGQWYVDVHSRVDLPPVMELRRADGSLVRTLEQGNIDALRAAGWRAPESFVAKGRDGRTDIWGLIVRPRDYDPAKRYPVIENIYAGPHDSFVPKRFWPFGYHSGGDKGIGMQALADLGFIVVQIDGMGTSNRSKAFHDVAWKNLGDSGFPDRIAWHRALAARDASYDISRVGIYGASAGGQSTLGALLFQPDFYKAGVAWNGCYDNRMDKISWNEQWMGWPVDESYARASGVDNAHRLRGDLLLIVGEQDSNVDPASTMQVVDALVRAGKDFDLLNIPGGEHTVGRSTGPIDYAHRRQFDFFIRHLQGRQTPAWNAAPDAPSR